MKIIPKYQPVCCVESKIILYKKGVFYCFNEKDETMSLIVKIIRSWKETIKESNRLFQRLFRTRIRNAVFINDEFIVYSKNNAVYYLDILKGINRIIYKAKKGFSAPLSLVKTTNKNNQYLAIWGEYGGNDNREEVSIIGVDHEFNTHILYTFHSHTIRHIHNIIPLLNNGGYYIMTGDNDENAGIYRADSNFNNVVPVMVGTHKARAVIAYSVEQGLLYATDSVEQINSINLLTETDGHTKLRELTTINGPCIYSTKCADGYIFSTTVESHETTKNHRLWSLLSTKRGTGVLSKDVHVVFVNKNLQSEVTTKFCKDWLPYKLFQYGAIIFPAGQENRKKIVGYSSACKKNDGNTIIFD